MKQTNMHIVICINNKDYESSLELHKGYAVIADDAAEEAGLIRVVDESGEDYLYPIEKFMSVTLSDEVLALANKKIKEPSA